MVRNKTVTLPFALPDYCYIRFDAGINMHLKSTSGTFYLRGDSSLIEWPVHSNYTRVYKILPAHSDSDIFKITTTKTTAKFDRINDDTDISIEFYGDFTLKFLPLFI